MTSDSEEVGYIEDETPEYENEGSFYFVDQAIDKLDLERSSGESPVRKLTRLILIDAIRKDASHIYIEKIGGVKYEFDGFVRTVMKPSSKLHTMVGDELRYIFGLLEEKELPLTFWQRFKGIIPKTEFVPIKDFSHGQIVTTRFNYQNSDCLGVLNHFNVNLSTMKLGDSEAYHVEFFGKFPEFNWQRLDGFVSKPGLYVISSPFNQGKTTTAYCMFSKFNIASTVKISLEEKASYTLGDDTRVLIAPEDPEYEQTLKGIRNYQPRQLLFDDVRHSRTLEEALYYACGGASVLVVVPARDISTSLTYLERLGVSRKELVANLRGVFSQRLIRKVNEEEDRGREPYSGVALVSQRIGISEIEGYKEDIIDGNFSEMDLPSFSSLVGKLVEEGITNENEANRVGYD